MGPSAERHLAGNLAGNLGALRRTRPDLARRLDGLVGGDHLGVDADGRITLELHGSDLPLELSPAACSAWLRSTPPDGAPFHVLGAGLGEGVQALLGARPASCVRVWERDPYLLRLALQRHDWRRAIDSGRLDLRLGVDGNEDLDAITEACHLAHPVLGQIYGIEASLLRRVRAGAAPTRWIGLLTGGLFVDDLATELDRRGFGVLAIEGRRWPLAEIETAVRRGRPELVLAVNYIGGLAELCWAAGVELAVWEIDPSTDRAPRVSGPTDHCFIHTYRRRQVAAYRAAGFQCVEQRLLAASPTHRRPVAEPPAAGAAKVSFVGSSMVAQGRAYRALFLAGHARWQGATQPDASAASWIEQALRDQRATPLDYRLPELLKGHFAGYLADCDATASEQDPLLLLAETAAAEARLSIVATLGPFGACVWGDEGWQLTAPHGVRWMGPAGHRHELNRIYASSQINVDLGRLYQSDIVTMRVFDVLACGGFLLAQHSPDLERCFRVGQEIESYTSLEELHAKLRYYLAHPAERARLAAAGRSAVLERHTFKHRLDAILERSRVTT